VGDHASLDPRPLDGEVVLVTRPEAPASAGHPDDDPLCAPLLAAGARLVHVPALVITPPDDAAPLEAAVDALDRYAAIIAGSTHAIDAVVRVAAARGHAPITTPWFTVGARTAAAARARGLVVQAPPGHARAEALVEHVAAALAGDPRPVLYVHAPEGRDVLPDGLRARGYAVEVVEAYRQRLAPPIGPAEAAAAAAATIVTVLSGRSFDGLASALGADPSAALLARARVAVIGPVAAEDAARRGIRVDLVAPRADAGALAHAIVERFGRAR
jgi:uroporphyrinogen-III synthase